MHREAKRTEGTKRAELGELGMSRIVATESTDALLAFSSEAELAGPAPEPISDDRPASTLTAFARETAADDGGRPIRDARTQHEMRLRLNAGYELFIQTLGRTDG